MRIPTVAELGLVTADEDYCGLSAFAVGHECKEEAQYRGSVGVGRGRRRWRAPQSVHVVARGHDLVALGVTEVATVRL